MRIATPPVKARTVPLTLTSLSRGRFSGPSVLRSSTPQKARTIPAAPPASANKTLSVSICRTSRRRPAPSAARIAISLVREVLRASKRLATLAQAMRRTSATAPRRISRAARASPTSAVCRGTSRMLQPVFESGYCFPRRSAIVSNSAWACEMVVPVFNTPITRRNREGRDVIPVTSNGAGIQRSASDKSGTSSRRTPTMVMRLPSRSNDCPTAPGSLPNRSCHRRRPRTTTWGLLTPSSAATNVRPSSGWTPRACKKPDVTTAPFTCAALSLPARLKIVFPSMMPSK